jgi:hypothetical protein
MARMVIDSKVGFNEMPDYQEVSACARKAWVCGMQVDGVKLEEWRTGS